MANGGAAITVVTQGDGDTAEQGCLALELRKSYR